MKKNSHLSTQEGLVDMATNLEIHIQSLDATRDNWDSTFGIIMQVHKPFLDKYTSSFQP